VTQRLAVLADVHGNEVALRAVLEEIDRLGVDGIVVAGDMVGFGPAPHTVTELLRERGARMIRGNHEKDYVANYDAPDRSPQWSPTTRNASFRWSMERIGHEHRAFLAALPDRLLLDDETLVVHGSPRHVRDSVMAHTPVEELEAMYEGENCRLAFSGHSHRAVIRETPHRRLVNVGSIGMPLDGDARASYAIVERDSDDWSVELRRTPFDVEAAIRRMAESGCGDVWPDYPEVYARTLRRNRDYLGRLLRQTDHVPDEQFFTAARAFLDANP
jgi:putative phosphoesterase